MNKTLSFFTFLALGFLVILSVVDPGSSVMWIASNSLGYNLARLFLMTLLLILILTNPPRSRVFRFIAGASAIVFSWWTLLQTYQNGLQILDGASFLLAAISMAIAALEYTPEEEPVMSPARKKMLESLSDSGTPHPA